jgi:glycosyltransferase involved in cell wall biosynthesis
MDMDIEPKPINILFESWYKLQHSYGIVSASLIVHLYENYHYLYGVKEKLFDFYIKDAPYYKNNWYKTEKNIYPIKYTDVFKQLKHYSKTSHIDIVYRQSFPYNIDNYDKTLPKIIFYTSEFGPGLDISYFTGIFEKGRIVSEKDLEMQILDKNLYFTTPSLWSSLGLTNISTNVGEMKNKIIPHGVDTSIYYPFEKEKYFSQRKRIRNKYNIHDDDILLFHLGAMTTNKGILLILQLLHVLVNQLKKTHFKLLLKGSDDLYDSKEMIKTYFHLFKSQKIMSDSDILFLETNNIIFINDTLTSTVLNAYFNICDVYISPYSAEGFGMVFLESLSSGLPIILPETGSTTEYIKDIETGIDSKYKNKYIYYVKSKIDELSDSRKINTIDINDLLKTILENENNIQEMKMSRWKDNTSLLYEYIDKNYSWYNIADKMKEYILNILVESNKK